MIALKNNDYRPTKHTGHSTIVVRKVRDLEECLHVNFFFLFFHP